MLKFLKLTLIVLITATVSIAVVGTVVWSIADESDREGFVAAAERLRAFTSEFGGDRKPAASPTGPDTTPSEKAGSPARKAEEPRLGQLDEFLPRRLPVVNALSAGNLFGSPHFLDVDQTPYYGFASVEHRDQLFGELAWIDFYDPSKPPMDRFNGALLRIVARLGLLSSSPRFDEYEWISGLEFGIQSQPGRQLVSLNDEARGLSRLIRYWQSSAQGLLPGRHEQDLEPYRPRSRAQLRPIDKDQKGDWFEFEGEGMPWNSSWGSPVVQVLTSEDGTEVRSFTKAGVQKSVLWKITQDKDTEEWKFKGTSCPDGTVKQGEDSTLRVEFDRHQDFDAMEYRFDQHGRVSTVILEQRVAVESDAAGNHETEEWKPFVAITFEYQNDRSTRWRQADIAPVVSSWPAKHQEELSSAGIRLRRPEGKFDTLLTEPAHRLSLITGTLARDSITEEQRSLLLQRAETLEKQLLTLDLETIERAISKDMGKATPIAFFELVEAAILLKEIQPESLLLQHVEPVISNWSETIPRNQ
jgi:hypothetical protein